MAQDETYSDHQEETIVSLKNEIARLNSEVEQLKADNHMVKG
jgi:hypothetical protein